MLGIALGLSVLYESEDDLIHDLYFGRRPWLSNAVMTGVWIGKASIEPWSRGRTVLRCLDQPWHPSG